MQVKQLAEAIFVIEDFFTRQECLDTIVRSEGLGYELAKINSASGSRVKASVRNNSRAFDNNEALAAALWERLRPFVPAHLGNATASGLNELFRFYRYQRGHQFRAHYDESYVRNPEEMSFLTFMVYLNDNFERQLPGRRHHVSGGAGAAPAGHGAGVSAQPAARGQRGHAGRQIRAALRRDVPAVW